jgi:hypothetical protein
VSGAGIADTLYQQGYIATLKSAFSDKYVSNSEKGRMMKVDWAYIRKG